MLRPGIKGCEVERAMREALEKHGFKAMTYLGHQIGTSPNDPPRIVNYEDETIEPFMIFCLEPAAYTGSDGTCGVRLEPVFLVTDHGVEMLSRFKLGKNIFCFVSDPFQMILIQKMIQCCASSE